MEEISIGCKRCTSNDVPVSYVQNNDTTYVDVLDKSIEMEEISIGCKMMYQ